MPRKRAYQSAWLGANPVQFDYRVAGKLRRGWCSARAWPSPDALRHIEGHCAESEAADVRLFAGYTELVPLPSSSLEDGNGGVLLFALPGLPPLDIVEFARTGTHNAPALPLDEMLKQTRRADPEAAELLAAYEDVLRSDRRPVGDRAWQVVREGLGRIWAICPFIVLFADPAGLAARFVRPVDSTEAALMEAIILTIAPESPDILPVATVAEHILRSQRFDLWWD